ncbi:hypothetical protein [Mycolicibacter longobardus]|uniref:hypothetical protein n=1 Tax=Mycolicibacter longobardus TaxID=1108812 RepID=UPI0010565C98|nr:hypothetical protein [Mycolicibacter longobardus]MCV7382738.1 hypothetical protein [Mycolicibacter longobardus]
MPAALMAGASLTLAGPAAAEPISGTYDVMMNGERKTTWTFADCGPGCTPGWRAEGTTWTLDFGDNCVARFDSATLAGTYGCGFIKAPMQLVKVG